MNAVAACAVLAAGVVCAACSVSSPRGPTGSDVSSTGGSAATDRSVVTITLLGDVMLGRGVGEVVASSPDTVFERLRPVVAAADLAVANLESPLTDRAHLVGPHALEADPVAAAGVLAGAGFDAMAIANNHAGDAGVSTVTDTIDALRTVGIEPIGGGADLGAATAPVLRKVNGVEIAMLAFDLTIGGPAAGDGPGIATWDATSAETAVRSARRAADVVVVGVHGGVEYLPRPDPALRSVVERLTDWGADVVWGHGAHVQYPVELVDGLDGRSALQAPGLGNALFDQEGDATRWGTVLEVVVDASGVVAHRTGEVDSYLRSSLVGWGTALGDDGPGDLVLVDGEWWILDRPVVPVASDTAAHPSLDRSWFAGVSALRTDGEVVDVAVADMTGDGVDEVVASYRTPFRERMLHGAYPGVDFSDAAGRSAHLGVFDVATGRLLWGAGTLLRPIGTLAGCDGSIAVAFTSLDRDAVTGGGAWTWRGFGFATAAEIDGEVTPGCADVDGDGRTEPVLLRGTAVTGGSGS